jgi:hypothetical protein
MATQASAYFRIIEVILRDRSVFFEQIREDKGTLDKIKSMLISALACFAIYGAVMGLANGNILQALTSMLKLPSLFLITLLICTPSLYFFNLLFGSRQTLSQTVALTLTAVTTSGILLLGFAPITLFFLLTASNYTFYKLLNVAFFGVAGLVGVIFLRQGVQAVIEQGTIEGVKARRIIFVMWVVLYAFVGSQMAWALRPFMGEPGTPFILFAELGGNFYSDVLNSLRQLFVP